MSARASWLWWVLWPVLLAYAVIAEVIQARADASQSVVIEFVAGLSFAVAGLTAWRRRPDNHLGRLMVLASAAWFIGSYQDAEFDIVPSIGLAFGAIEAIAITHVALAYPEGRLVRGPERALILAGYATAGAASLVILFTFNPRRDLSCPCPFAPFGVFRNPAAGRFAVDSTDKIAGVVVLVAVILLLRRFLRANVIQRSLLSPLWIAAVVAGITFMVRTTTNFVSTRDQAMGRIDDVLNALTMLIPVAFLVGLLRGRLDASPLGDLVVALGGGGTSGETLERELARALRDPSVELAYWLPSRGAFVDGAGRKFSLPAEDGVRATTFVERDGQRLAAIVHDRALVEKPQLIQAAAAAAGLALENERLQAELRAQIVEVQASRHRLIQASDDARQRIERDLHDGAQQRLLATALSLRMANDALDDGADPRARRALDDAATETLLAVAELRELAQGIHPSVLTEQGLRAAIEVLAERASVAVAVDVPGDRYPTSVEATAYFVVSEALANVAKHAQASRVSVSARCERDILSVEVSDDGIGGATASGSTGLTGLFDRVAASSGRLQIESPLGVGTLLRIELPCS